METPLRLSARQLESLSRAQHRREIVHAFSDMGLVVSQAGEDAFDVADAEGRSARLSFASDGAVRTESAAGRVFARWFDPEGDLVRLVDPAGLDVTFNSDPATATTRIVRQGHGAFELQHDSTGNLTRLRYPDGGTVRFLRTAASGTIFDQAGFVTRSEYGPDGETTAIVDRNGQRTEVEWPPDRTAERRPLRVTLPDKTCHEYLLGPTGTLERWSVDGDVVGRYSGDIEGFPTRAEFADGHWVAFREDENRLVAETPGSRLVLEYGPDGQLASEDQDGLVVRYERDRTGLLTAIVLPDGERLEFSHDGDGRLDQVRDWSGELTQIAWAPHGQVARIDHPNGVSTAVASNKLGLPTRIETTGRDGAPLFGFDYRHDALDRIAAVSDGTAERRFTYDPIGRLTAVESDGEEWPESWALDPMGNRLFDHTGPFTVDPANRISGTGERAIAYDVLGRTVSIATPRARAELGYNGQGQLIRADLADGTVAEYAYDALGRRIRKTVNGAVTRYLWAGQSLLREWREDGEGAWRQRDHLVLPGLFLPLAMRVDGRVYRQHTDHRCAPQAMTDAAGRTVWRARHKAFGEALISQAELSNPWRLPNQYEDDETGLHYNLARYYHPGLGRYLTPDPAFDPANGGNLYLYAAGDPINRWDPTGEIIPLIIAGAVIGAAIAGGIKAYQVRNEPGTFGQKAAKVAMAAGVGAVVGAVGAAAGAAVGAAVGVGKLATASIGYVMAFGAVEGTVSASAEACAEAALEGRAPTAKEVLLSAGVGGAIGTFTAGIGGMVAARMARKAAREAAERAAREAAEKAAREAAEKAAREAAEKAAKEAAEKEAREAAEKAAKAAAEKEAADRAAREAAEREAAEKAAKEAEKIPLKFDDDDLVYGPSAGGKLRRLQEESGGKLLTDMPKPPDVSWQEFTTAALKDAAESGRKVHFDLSNMSGIDDALAGTGRHADATTSIELRYIRDNWDAFEVKPKFYKDGAEVPPPWMQ